MTITLPIFVVFILIVAGAALGYAVRAGQRLRLKKIIEELQQTSVLDNTRIIELEKETLLMESRMREWKVPVIPLKNNLGGAPDAGVPKITGLDTSLRKQLLGKKDDNRHSASR